MCTKVTQRASVKEIQKKYKASLPPEEAAKPETPNYNANGYDHPYYDQDKLWFHKKYEKLKKRK